MTPEIYRVDAGCFTIGSLISHIVTEIYLFGLSIYLAWKSPMDTPLKIMMVATIVMGSL